MLRKTGLLLFVLFLTLGVNSPVNGQASLKWKFTDKDGKIDATPFYQTVTVTTQQNMTVAAQKVEQTQTQTFYFEWTPQEVDKDNKALVTLKQKVIGLKMNLKIGETPIEFDSTNTEKKDGGSLKEFFNTLLNAEFTLKVDTAATDPKKVIASIVGREKLVEKLAEKNPPMKELLELVLSEEALKEMAAPTFASIPAKEVKKDETWTRKVNIKMGPIGTYDTTYTYKYTGQEQKDKKDTKVALISVSIDLKYTKPDNAAGRQLPFAIKDATLTGKEGKGTIKFNTETGRMVSQTVSLKFGGELQIEIGGQVTRVQLDQKQDLEMTVEAKNPIKSAK